MVCTGGEAAAQGAVKMSVLLVGNGVTVSYDESTGCGPSVDLAKFTREAAEACPARIRFLAIGRLEQLTGWRSSSRPGRNKLSNLVSALAGGIR